MRGQGRAAWFKFISMNASHLLTLYVNENLYSALQIFQDYLSNVTTNNFQHKKFYLEEGLNFFL